LSLALCVGVAFLLLAGSAFAQTGVTAIVQSGAGLQVDVVATQVAKTNQVYVIPAGFGTVTRTMGVARQQSSGNFFLVVSLPSGFVFDPSGLPVAGDVTLTAPAPQGTYVTSISLFNSATVSGATYAKFLVVMANDFTSQATFSIDTSLWAVKDTATGGSLNAIGNTASLTVQTFDANTNSMFDSGTDSAIWIRAANGVTATVTPTTAVIDVSSLRKNFVDDATDDPTIDAGGTVNVTYTAGVYDAAGTLYRLAATDKVKITFSGTGDGLSGVASSTWSSGGSIKANNAGAPGVIEVLGNNTALPANGVTATVPVIITVNGTTPLTTRTINVVVETVIAANAAQSTTLVATTPYSTWGINGSVLLANWASANTSAFRSRIYIFNESATNNAQVLIRLFTLPIQSNLTGSVQVGTTVQLAKTLGSPAGMVIKLEDILTASGASAAELSGPDGAYNVAVEVTVYAPQTSGSIVGGVTGYTQTTNTAFTMSFGTTPLSKIQ